MKINKLLVHLFLYLLTIKCFSQTPMTIPDFSYRPSTIDGVYEGFLMQDGAYEPFHMILDLRVTSAEVAGTTSFSVGAINATFQIKGTYLRVKGSGENKPNPEDLAFIANDISVKSQSGTSILCKKEYRAKIEITADSVIFYGTWKNEGRAMFENYKLVLNSTNDCYPGTFRVAKPKQGVETKLKSSKDELIFSKYKNRFAKAIKYEYCHLAEFKEITSYKVTERSQNGEPMRIELNYITGYHSGGDEWKSLNNRMIEVLLNQGLPFATYGPESGWGANKYEQFPASSFINTNNRYDGFTNVEVKQIEKFFSDFKINELKNSASLQDVLQKHNSYPKEYSMTNCLSVIYKKQDSYKIKQVKNPDYETGVSVIEYNTESVYDGQVDVPYYKNNSTHTIVIKGIRKSYLYGKYVYSDASILLKPGEVTEYFKINKEFDNDSEFNVQFIGVPGIIKDPKH